MLEKKKPIETLIKMKLYGYEVEQEKLYYVKLVNHEKGYLNKNITGNSLARPIIISGKTQSDNFKTKFTEDEIKEINPLFWYEAFLEEVE